MTYVLINIGCAECRSYDDEPLVEELLVFDTVEGAKEHLIATGHAQMSWNPHPLGGVVNKHGSGDVWIAPSSIFSR